MQLSYISNINNLSLLFSLLDNTICLVSLNKLTHFFFTGKVYLNFNKIYNGFKLILFLRNFSHCPDIFKMFYFMYKFLWKESPLSSGFFTSIDLVGLGFRIARISDRVFFFDLGMSSGIYFFVPNSLRLYVSSHTRRLLLFSSTFEDVNNVISSLFLLRRVNSYKISGFQPVRSILRLRTGKQR